MAVKLVILLVALFVVTAKVMADPEKNRKYFAYFLIILFAQTGFAYSVYPGYHTSFAELLFFLLVAILFLSGGAFDVIRRMKPVARAVAIWFLVSMGGVLTALYMGIQPINIVWEFKSYVLYTLYLFLVPWLVRNFEDLRSVLWFLVLASLIPLLYSLPNLQTLADPARDELGHIQRVSFGQSWGALNILVGYLVPILPIAFGLLVTSVRGLSRFLVFLVVLLSLVMIIFSQTRTGWVATLGAVLLFALFSGSRKRLFAWGTAAALLLVLAIGAGTIGSAVSGRIEETGTIRDSSLNKRFERYENAVAIARAYPLTGSGWGGNFPLLPGGELSDVSWTSLPRWHSSFFEVLSQVGIPGLLAFAWLWLSIFLFAFRSWSSTTEPEIRTLTGALIAATGATCIYSLGELQFFKIETASVSWFLAGLLLTASLGTTVSSATQGDQHGEEDYRSPGQGLLT